MTTKKILQLSTPGAKVVKLFFFIADDKAKSAGVLEPGNHFPV
jgi:hypothetical protein